MGRDQAQSAPADEGAGDGFGAQAAVVGIRAVQDLVNQEQQRGRGVAREARDLAQAQDLGVEARNAALERVLGAEGGPEPAGDSAAGRGRERGRPRRPGRR